MIKSSKNVHRILAPFVRFAIERLESLELTDVLLMVAVASYIVCWSYISVEKYYSMNLSVFDAGLYMEASWAVLNAPWTLHSFIQTFSNNGIRFIIFPLALPQSYEFLLALQSFLLGFTALAFYSIGNHILRNKVTSLTISVSYLIYPALAGVNWFDIHYQMYFIPLFSFGYLFYLKKKYLVSGVLLGLSCLVHNPYEILVMLFVMVELLFTFDSFTDNPETGKKRLLLLLVLLALGLLYLTAFFSIYSSLGVHYSTSSSLSHSIFFNIDNKFFTLMLIFLPVALLPLFSGRWLILLSPFVYILFTSNLAIMFHTTKPTFKKPPFRMT